MIYYYFLIPISALLTTILDTSFFSFFDVFGATVVSSFAMLLILATLGYRKITLLFAACSVLFLSIFSSLPLYSMLASFLGLPLLILYLKDKVFYESSIFIVTAVFFISNLIFRIFLLPLQGGATGESLESIMFFPIINTLVCFVLYVILRKAASFFKK